MKFYNGQDMLNHYGHEYGYMEGMHVFNWPGIEWFKEKIKNEAVDPKADADNIRSARSFMFRNKMFQMFENAREHVWTRYQEEFDTIKEDLKDPPDDLGDIWCGPYDSDIKPLTEQYANLICPFSLKWMHPEYPEITVKNNCYQFKLDQPIDETDPHFLYDDVKVPYKFWQPKLRPDENDAWDGVYEQLIEDIDNSSHIPKAVRHISSLFGFIAYCKPEEIEERKREFRIHRKRMNRRYHD